MNLSWIKILIICLAFIFFPAIAAFAQQEKASVGLEFYVNPVLYSEIKDGRLIFENNSDEKISVYGDDRLIYSEVPSSGASDLQLSNYSSYSSFIIISAL